MTIEDLRSALDFPDAPWPDVDSAIYFLLTVDEIAGISWALSGEIAEVLGMTQTEVENWGFQLSHNPTRLLVYRGESSSAMYPLSDVTKTLAEEYPSCL